VHNVAQLTFFNIMPIRASDDGELLHVLLDDITAILLYIYIRIWSGGNYRMAS